MATARHRSKPQEVEAIQWTLDAASVRTMLNAGMPVRLSLGGLWLNAAWENGEQSWVPVPAGHWVVRMPDGPTHHCPVDPDHFAANYELADE